MLAREKDRSMEEERAGSDQVCIITLERDDV
jgi:hypothetical protein